MNVIKLVVACAVGFCSVSATFAQKSNDSIAQEVTAILQKSNGSGACNNLSSFTINGRSVAFSNCTMECLGDQQVANIADLDISSPGIEKHPFDSKLGLIVLPCRAGKNCVARSTGSNFGSKRGVGCTKSEVTVSADSVLFSVIKADGDAFRRLLQQIK